MSYSGVSGCALGLAAVRASTVASLVRLTPPVVDPATLLECKPAFPWSGCPAASSQLTGTLPQEYWTEEAHATVRGEPSRLVFLEDFVRQNLAAWCSSDGIENAAYDLGVGSGATVSEQLRARCLKAITNFNDVFQSNRWVVNPSGASLPYSYYDSDDNLHQSHKYFETWSEGAAPDLGRQTAALRRILGNNASDAQISAWLASVWEAIKSVPRYTGPCCGPEAVMPSVKWSWVGQPMPAPTGQMWRIVTGSLQPMPWLKTLLDLLSPTIGLTSALRTVGLVKKPVPVFKSSVRSASSPGWSSHSYVLGGILVMSVAAGAYWLWSR